MGNGTLALVRHGESEWNAKNVWTGWTDIGLSEKGKEEARLVAEKLKDIPFDIAFTSTLIRSKDTLTIILRSLNRTDVPITIDHALDERDYGVYTGKNKLEIQKQLGEVEYKKLRRGWDYPIPKGESLKQVYARAVPYYDAVIAPLLKEGKHVLIVAHGNSLRALIKHLENIPDEAIADVELATGEIVVYTIGPSGHIITRQKRRVEST